jgi:hypothetical protein
MTYNNYSKVDFPLLWSKAMADECDVCERVKKKVCVAIGEWYECCS